jgi:hypothetical protein
MKDQLVRFAVLKESVHVELGEHKRVDAKKCVHLIQSLKSLSVL